MRPERISIFRDAFYAVREAGSRLKNWPAGIAAGSAARELRFDPGAEPALNYGRLGSPADGPIPIGGQIKLIHLGKRFPARSSANILYLVSSALPAHVEEVVKRGKRLGMRLVWNQNGVAYPGCYGDFYPWFNRRMAALHRQADHVVYQSEFSRVSANRYLGKSRAPSEICLNPVDGGEFSPADVPLPPESWQILAAGTSHALYRTKSVLDTLRVLLSRGRRVHLTIAGEFRWPGGPAAVRREMKGLEDHVTILPPYRQSEAPTIYRRAHLLLHAKYNDPCPTVPIEAMSCGVPVVGTQSGGMPELVPTEAGILVPIAQSWTRDLAGDPAGLADAVESVMGGHAAMSRAAREHAVRTFDVKHWIERHEAVFRKVLAS